MEQRSRRTASTTAGEVCYVPLPCSFCDSVSYCKVAYTLYSIHRYSYMYFIMSLYFLSFLIVAS